MSGFERLQKRASDTFYGPAMWYIVAGTGLFALAANALVIYALMHWCRA